MKWWASNPLVLFVSGLVPGSISYSMLTTSVQHDCAQAHHLAQDNDDGSRSLKL